MNLCKCTFDNMNDKKVVSISERPLEPAHNRKERIETHTKEIMLYMRELHEICAAAGRPKVLLDFLDSLFSIALAWWCDDKEKREVAECRAERRTKRGKREGDK